MELKQEYLPEITNYCTLDEVRALLSSSLNNFTEKTRVQSGFMQSGNFKTGVSGWQLLSNGSIEANDILLRGSSANAVIINYGSNILLKEGGSIKFTSVVAPSACTATLEVVDVGNVDNGTHSYKVTYVNATGETGLGAVSNTVTVDDAHKKVSLSDIPISTSGSVTKRKIYRTKAGGSAYFLLTTINNNTTTTYLDTIADANLGVNGTYRTDNTFGKIIINDKMCASIGSNNTFLGYLAGVSNTTGYQNTAIGYGAFLDNTEGVYNTAVGYLALYANKIGYQNTAIGKNALYKNTEGYNNTAVGMEALRENIVGYGNVAIGRGAGYYETGSNKLFIDNQARANEADGRIKALIYGVFAAATADQKLTINGLLNLSVSKTPAASASTGTVGDIAWDASYLYICTATDVWERVAIAAW